MRKVFCGISVFAFLCLLSAGYYHTYLIEERQYRERQAEMTGEVRAVNGQTDGECGLFCLREEDGCVAVYREDGRTLYEPTRIAVDTLPGSLREEIRQGKSVRTEEELYSFLENYSS